MEEDNIELLELESGEKIKLLKGSSYNKEETYEVIIPEALNKKELKRLALSIVMFCGNIVNEDKE